MKLKTIPLEYRITPNQRRHVRKWVSELRSGRWKQGYGKMHNAYEQYCCLGVCSSIARYVKKIPSFYGYSFVYPDDPEGRFSGYPHSEWFWGRLGFNYMRHVAYLVDRDLPMSIATLNDNRFTFSMIADVIEAAVLKRKEVVINCE